MRISLLVPSLRLSLVMVGAASIVGAAAGLSGQAPRNTAAFSFGLPTPGPSFSLLRQGVQPALLTLADVSPISPDLEDQPPGGAQQLRPWPAENDSDLDRRLQQWGRLEVYRSHFWRPRPRPEDESAPIDVQSEVSLYRTAEGAQRAFAYRAEQLAGLGHAGIDLDIPADAVAAYQADSGAFSLQWVQFRRANGLGILLVTSFAGKSSPETAQRLARAMAQRMR